jgi:hypothetical protein
LKESFKSWERRKRKRREERKRKKQQREGKGDAGDRGEDRWLAVEIDHIIRASETALGCCQGSVCLRLFFFFSERDEMR